MMFLNSKTLGDSHKVGCYVRNWRTGQNPVSVWTRPEFNTLWNWCSTNCRAEFDLTVPDVSGHMYFLFEDAADATLFRLRWLK